MLGEALRVRRDRKQSANEVCGDMNPSSTIDPALQLPRDSDSSPEAARGRAAQVSPEQVLATREQVRQITQEIAELSQRGLSRDAYFAQFIQKVTTALASIGGAVWSIDAQGEARVVAQTSLVKESDQWANLQEHLEVLRRVVAVGQPIAIGPRSKSADLGVTNPTDHLLLLVPLQLEGRVAAVLEVFQRSHRGPATERGYLKYLLQVSELAEAFMRNQLLSDLRADHEWSRQFEQFLARIHSHLGVEETAFQIVNEARRLVGVDRVSLALGAGRHCRLKVVSGLDNVDRRAQQVRQLGRLAVRVIQGREPTWLTTRGSDLPPQIETHWNRYVDISHVRRCGLLPLFPPKRSRQKTWPDQELPDQELSDQESTDRTQPFGVLIFEQLTEVSGTERQRQQIEQVCHHSRHALHNALEHENLFLMPLWRVLGNVCDVLIGRHFTKTLLAIIVGVAVTVAMVTTKTDFTIPVRGTMQPDTRRTVFAREDGIITRVSVEHGEFVQTGQVLAELRNTDLDVEITSLVGKQLAIREQILSLQRALLDDPRLDTAQQNRLNGELLQLRQRALSIERQLQLVHQKEQQLVVRADHAGQIVTWHVKDKLLHRPVLRGQALMAIVDPSAKWELELYVPARHSGHVLDAIARSDQPRRVTFVLSSHAGQQFEGSLIAVDPVAVEREDLGNSVRVRVAIDAGQLPELKTDATVVAKIHCGQQPLGYAWFHDLIDAVQSRVLFWF